MVLDKRSALVLFVLIMPSYGWCQPETLENVSSKFKTDSVTAFLNDSTWHGRAFASRESWKTKEGTYKTPNYFYINLLSYVPYTTYTSDTTTTTQLVAGQLLSLDHIPTSVGTFNLSDSTVRQNLQIKVRYDLIEGGDAISDSYHLSQSNNNWIRIIRYDSKEGIVTGAFTLKLINRSGKVVHFTNGLFKARVLYELR
jgi:hypothetical protein